MELESPPEPPRFYVDECCHQWRGRLWGHLMTTGTEADLIAFGARIGLLPSWIQHAGTDRVHFDVTEPKKQAAIRAGARAVSPIEQFRLCILPKREKTNPENAAALRKSLGLAKDT